MKIWSKCLTKTIEIIFETKKFIVTLKSFQTFKMKIVDLQKLRNFLTSFDAIFSPVSSNDL